MRPQTPISAGPTPPAAFVDDALACSAVPGISRRSMRLLAAAAVLSGVLLQAHSVLATPGAVDPTFGVGGKALADFASADDVAHALALLEDGRIVVAGRARSSSASDVALARFTADGAPDRSFGDGGRVVADLGAEDAAYGVALQADGGIVVAGATGAEAFDVVVARFDAGGSLDPRFGDGGRARIDFGGGDDRARALALQPDGKMVVAGWTTRDGRTRPALVRLTADGALDRSFGGTGRVVADVGAADARAHAIALRPDGGIVVAGSAADDVLVASYRRDGTLDRSFADGGTLVVDAGGADAALALALAGDGAVVVAGTATFAQAGGPAPAARVVLVRLTADGKRDASFGGAGVVLHAIDGRAGDARALALQADGRLVVAGSAAGTDADDLLLLRVLGDGSLDASFGAGGIALTDFASRGDAAHALALQPDGRIVAAGSTGGPASLDALVARFRATPPACGDGIVDAGEACDAGAANGGKAACCDARCRLAAAGTPCREAAGACDVAERCDGVSALCPEDAFLPAGSACSAATGACDVPETCTGDAAGCPADRVRPAGTLCRPARGPCDRAEECDGLAAECPADAKSRSACRSSVGPCDVAEFCDGEGDVCPADATVADGTACEDGLACTTGDVCEAGRCAAGERDRFGCAGYLCSTVASDGRMLLRGAMPAPARVLGEGAADVVRLSGPQGVCFPAVTARDEGEVDPELVPEGDEPSRPAYVAYALRAIPRHAAAARRRDVVARRVASLTVVDQFGTAQLQPVRAQRVSLPGSIVREDTAVGAVAAAAESYACYAVEVRSGAASRLDVTIRLEDESTPRSYRLQRRLTLCLPLAGLEDAIESGDAAEVGNPIVCYRATRVRTRRDAMPLAEPLVAEDGFATHRIDRLAGGQQLCVPGLLAAVTLRDASPPLDGDGKKQVGKRRKRAKGAAREPKPKKKRPRGKQGTGGRPAGSG
jgi:uncharacterized delta-60 repeat protein